MHDRARRLLWIVLIAFALRFAVGLIFLPDRLDPVKDHWEFDYENGTLAGALATGHGYSDPYPFFGHSGPSALMPPVYPFLLAAIFKIFGLYTKASAVVALLINCLFPALAVLPVYSIAAKCFSPRVASWSAWLWALFPYNIYWSAAFPWSTTLEIFCLVALILYALNLESTTRLGLWLGFGLLWGFSALNDPSVLSALPVVAGWPICTNTIRGNSWKLPAAVAALAAIIVPAPWVVRNSMVFHRPVFIRDTFWVAFRISNTTNSIHWEDDSAVPAHNPSELAEMARLGELNYMDAKREQSLAFVREHPGLFVRLTLRKIVFIWTGFWSLRKDYLALEPYDFANIPLSTLLTILTLLGLRKMFREAQPHRWLFLLILLIFPLVYYFTDPLLRHRGPLDPLVVMLSVYALVRSPAVAGKTEDVVGLTPAATA